MKLPEMIDSSRGDIVLDHLLNDPVSLLERTRERGDLDVFLPELGALVNLSQKGPHHTEDAFVHTLNVIRALPENKSVELLLAAVFHDIGKAPTRTFDDEKHVYHFFGHEKESEALFDRLCDRLGWTHNDFDRNKVSWLIRQHQKAHFDWDKCRNPKAKIKKHFFQSGQCEIIPPDYRNDLIALLRADVAGAVPQSEEIMAEKRAACDRFEQLVRTVEIELSSHSLSNLVKRNTRKIWNGNIIMSRFNVTGPAVGRLLKLGQEYVEQRLQDSGEDIFSRMTTEEIYQHVRQIYPRE